MEKSKLEKIIYNCIRLETGFEGTINNATTAIEVEGWDSLAHVRIMFSIDLELNTVVELDETHAAQNVGELIKLFETLLGK
jgi:acyl carrier protein